MSLFPTQECLFSYETSICGPIDPSNVPAPFTVLLARLNTRVRVDTRVVYLTFFLFESTLHQFKRLSVRTKSGTALRALDEYRTIQEIRSTLNDKITAKTATQVKDCSENRLKLVLRHKLFLSPRKKTDVNV
jgi:hypothetical protein